MRYLICRKSDHQVVSSYEADQPQVFKQWDASLHTHVPCPDHIAPALAQAVPQNGGGYQIVEHPAKKNAARQKKLDAIRQAREAKLKRVDELVNVAFLNSWTANEKTELRNYRTALLEITEPFKDDLSLIDAVDLETFAWPEEPSES